MGGNKETEKNLTESTASMNDNDIKIKNIELWNKQKR